MLDAPGQAVAPAVAATATKLTVMGEVVLLVKVKDGMLVEPLVAVMPVIPEGGVLVQLIFTLGVTEDNVMAVLLLPEQMLWLAAEKLTRGAGFTVMVNVSDGPPQATLLKV